ncbi:MAG: class I SAM-dependent methyltransferase [Gammaproteobacteria bacterium]|nr:class I SAM-dependent methyltransferase [Gammaproteobacteria bacterium]MCW8973625.1 class I SAM-dependent methyltransferase [Gammaproteobacteria bacterium]MCW8993757.1 class I SAM-dependent methyltransferase [Gammaproteobacteria bacterium]
MEQSNLEVWRAHARQWQRVGAPLRPTQEDGELLLALSAPALSESVCARLLVMGVTPEVVQLEWPSHVELLAVDHSQEMIDSVWCPHHSIPSAVKQASWQSMPLEEDSVDSAVGDGCLTVLPSLADYERVFAEVARVLRPGGSLVLRCFIRPDTGESIESVVADAMAGRVGSFHTLKWRVAMTLSADEDHRVPVADIHALFEQVFPDRGALAQQAGWQREVIDTIDAYRGVGTVYTFPVLDAVRRLASNNFEVSEVRCGSYELAERCPTVLFTPIGKN